MLKEGVGTAIHHRKQQKCERLEFSFQKIKIHIKCSQIQQVQEYGRASFMHILPRASTDGLVRDMRMD